MQTECLMICLLCACSQVPTLVLDCDTDVDVDADTGYQASIVAKVAAFSDYVRELMLARAHALLALERATAAASSASSSSSGASSEEGAASGSGAAPYNGYTIVHNDTLLYLDKDAPLVAYATQRNGGSAQAASPAQPQQQAEAARETVGSTGARS